MVGVNSFIYRFGTVAIFATLFAAIQVKGDRGCVFNFDDVSDFELECNEVKHSWTVGDDLKYSPKKKVLVLEPGHDGCLKTKNTVTLNASSPVVFRYYREGTKDENETIKLRLIPREGSCPDEDCLWIITNEPQFKSGEWVDAQHKFPLKSMKEYYVQLQVDKNKGKLLVESIALPSAFGSCVDGGVRAANEAGMKEVNVVAHLADGDAPPPPTPQNGTASLAPGLAELSKNLMLTSASVLTLNNLLN